MPRPKHAKAREKQPLRRVWLVVVLLAAGLLAIPATAQDAPTTCDYSQSHLHNGWGWDADSEKSCAPAQGDDVGPNLARPSDIESSQVPLMVGTCDYSKSHHYDGYGWDETNGVSCEPLLTTSTTEYVPPEPGSPEDGCDYAKSHLHDGYGWDEINGISCEPMARRIAKAARKNDSQVAEPPPPTAQTRPPVGSAPVHPDDWDGDGALDPSDSFPFDPSRY